MSYTWTQFKTAVINAYQAGAKDAAREEAALQAVADYVKGQIIREVEGDLQIAKSYRDSYLSAKVKLAGYTITSNFAAVKAAVLTRLTVDAARTGISESAGYNDKQIQQGIDDFNGAASTFDSHLVGAALELQRHVPRYQSGHRDIYAYDDSDVSARGLASILTLPAQSRIDQVLWTDAYVEPLEANTAYAVDDEVESNGRIYVCVEAGTSANPLGDGLLETEPEEDETSGTAVFHYLRPTCYREATPVGWRNIQRLLQSEGDGGAFGVDPQGAELWFHPALDDERAILLVWSGLKHTFADNDATAFDQPAATFAAEWIRGMILKSVAEDERGAASSFALATSLLKRLWLDSTRSS